MNTRTSHTPYGEKEIVFERFGAHVSSGKAAFFKKYEMDMVIGRREGPYLWDLDGDRRLFNLHCNGGVFNLGHRNRELIELLKNALDRYDIGNSHLISKPRADLGRELARRMPGDLDYTIFGAGGGEAVDLAIKVARGYTGRTGVISAGGGYHGHTGLAVAAGDKKYRSPFRSSHPDFLQVPFGDTAALSAAVDRHTAAVILEPIPATLGVVIPPEGYLKEVSDLCRRKEIVLILDEVQTGLGRTGMLWAFEYDCIIPDIVVLGKGLSGGLYPISATVIRSPLEAVFHVDPFIHVSTFGGSEVGCILAQRVLEIVSDPAFLAQVNRLAGRFAEQLAVLGEKHTAFLRGLRQRGLMMGLELRDAFSGPLLSKTAFDSGLLMVYANNDTRICQLLPPLTMTLDQVDEVSDRLDRALSLARAGMDAVLRIPS